MIAGFHIAQVGLNESSAELHPCWLELLVLDRELLRSDTSERFRPLLTVGQDYVLFEYHNVFYGHVYKNAFVATQGRPIIFVWFMHEEFLMLSEILRRLLDERGISIAELSRKTDVPKSNINTWLQGSSPNIDQADKVARYFGVPIEYLVFGRDVGDPLEEFFEKVEIHKGEYEISVKKLVRKK